MLDLIRIIADRYTGRRLGAVVHLGAGMCRQIGEYRRLGSGKVLLVEADPRIAEALRANVVAGSSVEVLDAAVAPGGGRTVLRVLNDPHASSLYVPGRLLKRRPNLRVVREVSVPALTLGELLSTLGSNQGAGHLMVIELQGAERAVLASVDPAELEAFEWIAVRTSREPLYEGGACYDEIDTLLGRRGFRQVHCMESGAIWPFLDVLYRRDERLVQLHAFTSEMQSLRHSLEAQQKALAESAARIADLEKHNAALRQSEAVLKRELAEARRTASLSTKLQALREADLEDLRERYRQSVLMQEKQRDLLARLGERLTIASGYFRELMSAGAVPLTGEREGAGAATRSASSSARRSAGGEDARRRRRLR